MSFEIPFKTDYTLERGDGGVATYALQRSLRARGFTLAADGDYGAITENTVRVFQGNRNLLVDGKAGGKTQHALAELLALRIEREKNLPALVLYSQIMYESAGYFGAVNWSVGGGVDCGQAQRRVYAADYDNVAKVKIAFDSTYQFPLVGDTIVQLVRLYAERGMIRTRENRVRAAVLYHNYPAFANRLSQVGSIAAMPSYYHTPQQWVMVHDLTFPSGRPINTPVQWAQRYALGNALEGEPGQAVKYVVDWT